MKVLLTGAAGYIGTVLLRHLTGAGHHVRCLDLRAGDIPILLPGQASRCEIYTGDIRDFRAVSTALRGVEAVIHLAAVVGYPACDSDPDGASSINVDGTDTLLRALLPGVTFVFMSTSSVYGRAAADILAESDPINPLSHYGRTKAVAEGAVLRHGGIALRPVTAYGPSPRFRTDLMVHDFIALGLAGYSLKLFQPDAVRPFIQVEDICRALIFSLDHADTMAGNVYNLVAADSIITKRELARRVAALTGLSYELDELSEDKDGRDYRIDGQKILKLGFEAKCPLEQGLQGTVDWMRTNMQDGKLPR